MKNIDPTVDYAFKKVMSQPALLCHFLNACFAKEGLGLVDIHLENPFNDRDFEGDKLTVVDVRARDMEGRIYQIEVQLTVHPWLNSRMIYTWADIYGAQIQEGEAYTRLKPVLSIWLLGGRVFDNEIVHHRFVVYDREHKVQLNDHLVIHTLELPKCPEKSRIKSHLDLWIYYLHNGKKFDPEHPPPILKNHQVLGSAMAVLERIAKKKEEYRKYQAREFARRDMDAIRLHLELVTQQKEAERRRAEAAEQKRQQLLERIGELSAEGKPVSAEVLAQLLD